MVARNKIKKRIILWMLMFVFCMNNSILAFAEEAPLGMHEDSDLINISCENMSSEQVKLVEKLMSQDELQVGDIIILSQTEDEVFYLEVTDSDKVTRNAEVTSKTFVLTRSILGIKQRLFSVTAVCDWISDGVNSKITNFDCRYEILASGVGCYWNSDFERKTDLLCTYCLEFY